MEKIICLLFLFSCSTDSKENTTIRSSDKEVLAENHALWIRNEPEIYSYEVRRSYGPQWGNVTSSWRAMIGVEKGKVTCRRFFQTGTKEREYIENESDVGSHPFGFPPKTMTDLFAECETILEKNAHSKNLIFIAENGIVRSCFLILTEDQQLKMAEGFDSSISIQGFYPDQNKCKN